jgi:Ca-activated chloride channel homolog
MAARAAASPSASSAIPLRNFSQSFDPARDLARAASDKRRGPHPARLPSSVRHTFSEFDGEAGKFLSPDDLFPHPAVIEFILQHGQDALDALPDGDDQVQALIEEMIQAGLMEKDAAGNLKITPRMLRGMQHRSFLEIFRNLKPGVRDGHASPEPGRAGERSEGTKAYQWGDPLSDLALGETMRNAMRRLALEAGGSAAGATPSWLPIKFRDSDFELHNHEATADSALVILMDLSGSMMRYGRHVAAKRVALGMRALVRARFPLDTVEFIGFSSVAEPISEAQLPLVMPKPITTREWNVKVRVPLDQADRTHPHFTNLHHALRMARGRLSKRGAANKQVFIITDGEPTAHLSGDQYDILNLIYPASRKTAEATLAEAFRCHQAGIRLSTFALIEEYHGMEWVGFVDQLTRLVRGVAFYCTAGDLAATIMESYLSGKRQKKPLG